MKRHGKKNLKIIALTTMSIFTLFTCFSAAMAWFQAKTQIDNSAGEIRIKPESGLLTKITIHTLNTQDDSNYTFNSTPKGTVTINWEGGPNGVDLDGNTAISLGMYDPLDQSRPLLLLFELKESVAANLVPIVAETETEDFVGRVENANGNPLSSVIKSSSTSFATSPIGSGDTFNIAKGSLGNKTHFVNISYDSTGFPQIAEDGGFEQEQTFFSSTSTEAIRYIGVVLDYYEDAMTYLFAVNLGNPLFDMDVADPTKGVINFICDWTMVV